MPKPKPQWWMKRTPEREGPTEAELTLSVTVKDGIRYTILKPMPAIGCETVELWAQCGARMSNAPSFL